MIRVECVFCQLREEATRMAQLFKNGWVKVKPVDTKNISNKWKSHLGWCQSCVERFDVKEDGQ